MKTREQSLNISTAILAIALVVVLTFCSRQEAPQAAPATPAPASYVPRECNPLDRRSPRRPRCRRDVVAVQWNSEWES